jgi:RNA polymerase sigma factor (sigma-70 family)
LIEAWRNRHHLRDASRLDAWLNGICYNMIRRWLREQSRLSARHVALEPLLSTQQDEYYGTYSSYSSYSTYGWHGSGAARAVADHPVVIDPAEDLDRLDLLHLLDRAMGHLPESARSTLALRYVADLSPREAAERIGISDNAFEVRLHRAHQQLRQVLSRELYTEALAFGLSLDADAVDGWRPTRYWCFMCGQHRLTGKFEPYLLNGLDGAVNLRLRCPDCSAPQDYDIVQTVGMVPLAGLRSFRPALKRAMQAMPTYFTQLLTHHRQVCPQCGGVALLRGIESRLLVFPLLQRFCVVCDCARCGPNEMSVVPACLAQPAVMRFMEHHPRAIIEPEQLSEYAGQPAIRVALADVASTARLTIFLDCQTLGTVAAIAS